MIMRGTTPRSLTWAGCLGLASLGLVLLPVLPSWAQTESIQKEVEVELRRARARQEAEERVRRVAQDERARAVDVEKARAELDEAKVRLEAMLTQLEHAKAQLKLAQERLAQLEGRRGEKKTEAKITITIKDAEGNVRTIEVPSGADVIRRIERELPKKFEFDIKPRTAPLPPTPPTPPAPVARPAPGRPAPAPDARMRDLEKRLDGLMKEIESIRREMRTPRPREDPNKPRPGLPRPPEVPNKPTLNPPAGSIEGVIKNVDASGLTTLSIGSDAGLQTGHTLEVYRLEPSPMYLGTLRILNVRPKEAVGQPLNRLRAPLQPDDRVTPSISPR
jgi:hypothetical protein